jgi:hypothetical protein
MGLTPEESAERIAVLEARVSALEARVDAFRALHRRVADLDDVVAHLLLPAAAGGDAAVAQALAAYREEGL